MAEKKSNKISSQPTDEAHSTEQSHFPPSAPIQARVVFGEVTYFALTSEQINTYTTLGWLLTLCLTLIGMLFEAAFGCWLALTQGNLSATAYTTINNVKCATIVTGSLMVLFAGIFWWLKAKNKDGWLTNTVKLEQ